MLLDSCRKSFVSGIKLISLDIYCYCLLGSILGNLGRLISWFDKRLNSLLCLWHCLEPGKNLKGCKFCPIRVPNRGDFPYQSNPFRCVCHWTGRD